LVCSRDQKTDQADIIHGLKPERNNGILCIDFQGSILIMIRDPFMIRDFSDEKYHFMGIVPDGEVSLFYLCLVVRIERLSI